jgi:hypothetical protein
MTSERSPSEPLFQEVVDALLDADNPLPPRYLYQFSDLGGNDLHNLERNWSKIPDWRRRALLEDLEGLSESDYLFSFEEVGRLALNDNDPKVRFFAIRLLTEYEVIDLIPTYLEVMETDQDEKVRSIAVSALGRFVYLGELEKIHKKTHQEIENRLLAIHKGPDSAMVRQRALESLGYSSRTEIPKLIEDAFISKEDKWIACALYAMGRSCDERWQGQVLDMLDNQVPDIRVEAVRAAGELEIREAVPQLMVHLDQEDDTLQAAIWSLSQIGGKGVKEALVALLDDSEDEEEIIFLESALDNLIFNESTQIYGFFDIPDNHAGDEVS